MKKNNLMAAAFVVALGFATNTAFAQAPAPAPQPSTQTQPTPPANMTPAQKAQWDKDHPRRAQVNSRLNNQNARTDNKVDDGKMSKAEASKIHTEDHSIRKEERRDAAANGGHITKAEQKHINHQENKVSHQIKTH